MRDPMTEYCRDIESHYLSKWVGKSGVRKWDRGPVSDLPVDFCVLEFEPLGKRNMWTYATCCMSQPSDVEPIELHLFAPHRSDLHVELLTIIAHYHRTGNSLGLGHTVNFGRPWIPGASVEYGLISLPYLDGPSFEVFRTERATNVVRFLWLIPITHVEREFKKAHGLEALERKFEESNFNYLDPRRGSVV